MKLDRYTVRKQWLIAWEKFWGSWSHFEWYRAVFDNKRITIFITMLFIISLIDGTILNYIGKDSKTMVVEEIGDSIQVRQDNTVTICSSREFAAYHKLRLGNGDHNGCELDYFVRINGVDNCSMFCNVYGIIRELGQFCFRTEFSRLNQSSKSNNDGVRREDLECRFGTRQHGKASRNRGGPGSFYFEQVVVFIKLMRLEFFGSSSSFNSAVVTKAVFSEYKVYKNNSGSFIQEVDIDYQTGYSKAVYKLKELKDKGDRSHNKSEDSAHSKLSKGPSSCQCLAFDPVTLY